MADSEAVSYY